MRYDGRGESAQETWVTEESSMRAAALILELCGVCSTFALFMIAGYAAERAGRRGAKDAFVLAAWFLLLVGNYSRWN